MGRLTPGSPQTNAISPAMNDPTSTIPMASPAVKPLAKLLDPNDHAEELTAAAILDHVSLNTSDGNSINEPEAEVSFPSVMSFLGRRGNNISVRPPVEALLILTLFFDFPGSEGLRNMRPVTSPRKGNHLSLTMYFSVLGTLERQNLMQRIGCATLYSCSIHIVAVYGKGVTDYSTRQRKLMP